MTLLSNLNFVGDYFVGQDNPVVLATIDNYLNMHEAAIGHNFFGSAYDAAFATPDADLKAILLGIVYDAYMRSEITYVADNGAYCLRGTTTAVRVLDSTRQTEMYNDCGDMYYDYMVSKSIDLKQFGIMARKGQYNLLAGRNQFNLLDNSRYNHLYANIR